MTHSDTLRIFLLTTTVLPFIVCNVSKSDYWFKKLSPDEIFPIAAWLPQIDYFKVKSCGSPSVYFSASATPVPFVANKFARIDINFTSAHDLIAGDFIVNYNRWPYHLEADACDWPWRRFGVKVCPIVKGGTYYLHAAGVLNFPETEKGQYAGNVSLVNDDDEVILCLIFVLHI
ncbi:putative phosphatidylglycerol/phosphatidylinositol transfer protein DDB_G0285639 [Amphiura filiformis]|uniref:putative phosphatidylglycerol/phosphatidylinositol transfer protein DDB_G0285639 n=1 Tax=Amphiura filiformis TaxID=82378 RepID=UPI003B20F953